MLGHRCSNAAAFKLLVIQTPRVQNFSYLDAVKYWRVQNLSYSDAAFCCKILARSICCLFKHAACTSFNLLGRRVFKFLPIRTPRVQVFTYSDAACSSLCLFGHGIIIQLDDKLSVLLIPIYGQYLYTFYYLMRLKSVCPSGSTTSCPLGKNMTRRTNRSTD